MMPTSFFNDLLQTIVERGRTALGRPRLIGNADMKKLCDDLLSGKGEASGVALARLILDVYSSSTIGNKLAFIETLAQSYGSDGATVDKAIAAYQAAPNEALLHRLYMAAEPRRQELIRRLNLAPGGTAALVRLREDLLTYLPNRPDFKVVDQDLQSLFSSWFNRGFLVLQSLSWNTPASILEKVIRYEAVHEIDGWDDLRRRLEPTDRRCFAFFHPRLAEEPLIFVEVALTKEIPSDIPALLAEERNVLPAKEASTAVFYSISNTQKGLAGVSFGNFLIKQVAEDLKRALPNLKTFVTLSPVPGFARWLKQEMAAETSQLLNDKLRSELALLGEPDWMNDEAKSKKLNKAVMAAAAVYFLKAKTSSGKPVDPVARFHLRNGARLERLNFLGNPSPDGMKQSHGLMVNYLYDLDEIERNHEAFAGSGEVVASSAVKKLLSGAEPQKSKAAAAAE